MSIGGKCGVGTGKTMSDTLTVVAEDTSVGWVPLRKLRLDEQNRGASKMETSVTSLDRFQRGRIITHKIQCGQHISIAYRNDKFRISCSLKWGSRMPTGLAGQQFRPSREQWVFLSSI